MKSEKSVANAVIDLLDQVEKKRMEIDSYFLIIQSDRKLMKQYLDIVSDSTLKVANMAIGREIGRRYGAKGMRRCKPQSLLIQSCSELG